MVFSDDFPEGQLVVSRKRWPNLESPTPQPALLPALAEHCVEYAKCFETCSDTTDCTRYPDMAWSVLVPRKKPEDMAWHDICQRSRNRWHLVDSWDMWSRLCLRVVYQATPMFYIISLYFIVIFLRSLGGTSGLPTKRSGTLTCGSRPRSRAQGQ